VLPDEDCDPALLLPVALPGSVKLHTRPPTPAIGVAPAKQPCTSKHVGLAAVPPSPKTRPSAYVGKVDDSTTAAPHTPLTIVWQLALPVLQSCIGSQLDAIVVGSNSVSPSGALSTPSGTYWGCSTPWPDPSSRKSSGRRKSAVCAVGTVVSTSRRTRAFSCVPCV